jgi:tryptophan synthase beta chain
LAYLHQISRVRFEAATDDEVLETMRQVMQSEGIIPALESAHAFVTALKEALHLAPDNVVLVNQSGRGDKDIFTIAEALDDAGWRAFLRDKVASWEAPTCGEEQRA